MHVTARRTIADQSKDVLTQVVADISELMVIVNSSEFYSDDVRAIDSLFSKVARCKVCRDNRALRIEREDLIDVNVSAFAGIGFFQGPVRNQDYLKATNYLHIDCNQGKHEASYYLGKMYYERLGVEKCFKRAIIFFEVGAKLGNDAATYRLSRYYYYGPNLGNKNCRNIV